MMIADKVDKVEDGKQDTLDVFSIAFDNVSATVPM